jgi:hypothetical protein
MKVMTGTVVLFVLISFAVVLVLQGAGCGVAKDTRLQLKIKEELGKSREIQADKLTINVREGVVTITGELNTREEIDKVVQIVKAIDGVVDVKDLMTLPDNYNSRNPTFLDPFN